VGLIPESTIEQVLARADIVDVVRRYVSLEKSGKNWKGLCPFHDDHDPSLKVHEGKGIYKCFACGAGGNAIGFIMELEGWSFPEAVRHLADQYGVEMPDQDPEEAERQKKRRNRKQQYFHILETAGEFYESNLWGPAGDSARHYLEERGIDEETARAFQLGYAPQGWENLLDHLADQVGISAEAAEWAGLALEGNHGYYDRFRHRIVFPIVDIWNHVRGFGGRILAADSDAPKYMNSPETEFYTKSDILYGLDVAKQHFGEDDYALLVEGNFDVIALHAAGFHTTVAPMGTALTDKQAELLGRYTKRVVIAFDGDDAGEDATRSCLSALEAAGLEGRVVRFEEWDDPDSFVRREGPAALQAKIENASPLIEWTINRTLDGDDEGGSVTGGSPIEQRMNALDSLTSVFGDISRSNVWRSYVEQIASRFELEAQQVANFLEDHGGETSRQQVRQSLQQAHEPPALRKAEFGILVILLHKPEWLSDFLADDYDNLLGHEGLASFVQTMRDHYQQHDALKESVLIQAINDPGFRQTVLEAMDPDEAYAPTEPAQMYNDYIRSLKKQWAERMLRQIQQRLDQLDFSEDRDEFERLERQRRELASLKDSLSQRSR
jgi:DNA primase